MVVRASTTLFATALSLAVNVLVLILLVRINAHVSPPAARDRVEASYVDFTEPARPRRRPRPRPAAEQVKVESPPLPALDLPSSIQAPTSNPR